MVGFFASSFFLPIPWLNLNDFHSYPNQGFLKKRVANEKGETGGNRERF